MNRNKFNMIVLFIIVKSINHSLAFESKHLDQSLNLIIKQTFLTQDNRLTFHINFSNSSKEQLFKANDFINDVLHDINNVTYKVLYQHKKSFVNFIHNEIILMDNLDAFRYFYGEIYNVGSLNFPRTLMFISSITTLDFNKISLVFKDLYHMSILQIAFIVRLATDDIVMLTYYPFNPTSCHDITPVIINRYLPDQQRWANFEYFPKKLQDFFGCPLTCCTLDDMPYFTIKYYQENRSVADYWGIEAELLKFSAKKLNFSIRLHLMDNKELKNAYNEGSIFVKLFSETCDFALGGFAYKKQLANASIFSQTNLFFLSHVHMVTNVLNVYTSYEKIAFPFHYSVWYMLGLVLAISSILIYTCEQRRQWQQYRNFIIGSANTTPQFYLYAVAVGANMTKAHIPKSNFARFLLTCWLLATLVLRSAYQSGMYQMIRDNKQWNPPKTIADVFAQNYLISMTPENRKYLTILPEIKRMRIFNTTMLQTFPELLKAKEPMALITPYEYFGYVGIVNTTQWRSLHLVKERLLTQQLIFYVRHHSYMLDKLNDDIGASHAYGFITYWNRQNSLQLARGHHRSAGVVEQLNAISLSLLELGAIFMILVWLELFAIAVFLIELIWKRISKITK